jgi:hypothetical protein
MNKYAHSYNHDEVNDYFIISKDYTLNENDEIEFINFYDLNKKTNYTLTIKDKKMYMCSKLDLFGSLFYGNYVYEEPMTIIIKEVDPVLFLISVIYIGSDSEKWLSFDTIIGNYIENLNNSEGDLNDKESSIVLLDYLKDLYITDEKKSEIEKICDKYYGMNNYK